jgi:hypothetical protein
MSQRNANLGSGAGEAEGACAEWRTECSGGVALGSRGFGAGCWGCVELGIVAVVETGVLRFMKPVDWIDGKGRGIGCTVG